MATQPTMEDILEYGLISEFSYLTLESKYFQKITTNDFNQYSSENIKNYLQATAQQIESNIPLYDEGFVESADAYRDIKADRIDEVMAINERYEVLEFKSDPNSDLQIMLLQNKQTGKYVIASMGTSSITDVQVDTGQKGSGDNDN
jgi:hypothetical protein